MYKILEKKLILFIIFISIISLNFQAIFAKTNSLESAIKKFAQIKNKYRITVADFKNTSGHKTKYDIYIADSILHELGKYKNFKLIERQRLHSVLNELKLTNSGIIKPGEALKIGNMLPVDLICTGSYTIINSRININARFINVVSGEIIKTLAFSFEKDENLAGKIESGKTENESNCNKLKNEVLNNLKNLNGKERINKAVESAIKIPFDLKCGAIHFEVIKAFRKYKIYNIKYQQFLMKTLSTITEHSKDKRTGYILSYFRLDEKISDDEWNAFLKILITRTSGHFHTYLRLLLNNKKDSIKTVNKRIEIIWKFAKEKKVGLPVAFNLKYIFFSILGSLSDLRNRKIENILHLLKNYSEIIPDERRYNSRLFYIFRKEYRQNRNSDIQNRIISLFIEKMKNRTPYKDTALDLCFFAEEIERYIETMADKEKYKKQLRQINKNFIRWFCFYKAHKSSYIVRKVDIDAYFKRYSLTCK